MTTMRLDARHAHTLRRRAAARARQRRTDPPAAAPLDRAFTATTAYLATMPAATDEDRRLLAAEILAELLDAGWTPPNGHAS